MRKPFEIPKDYEKFPFPDVVNDESGDYGWKTVADLPNGATVDIHCPYCHGLICSTREILLRADPGRCPHCHRFFAYVPKKR